MTTYLDLQSEVTYRVGNTSVAKTNATDLARIKACINSSQQEICALRRWNFLTSATTFMTVASTALNALTWGLDTVWEAEIEWTALHPQYMTALNLMDARGFQRAHANTTGQPSCFFMDDLTTAAYYAVGTIALTAGSTTVTGTGTTFTAAMAGKYLRRAGDSALYKIQTFTNTTTLVLATAYGGTTGTTLSYQIDPPGCLQMRLIPTPSTAGKTVRVYGKQKAPYLINDTDYTIIPPHFSNVLVALSTRKYKEALGVDWQTEAREYMEALEVMRGACRSDTAVRSQIRNYLGAGGASVPPNEYYPWMPWMFP